MDVVSEVGGSWWCEMVGAYAKDLIEAEFRSQTVFGATLVLTLHHPLLSFREGCNGLNRSASFLCLMCFDMLRSARVWV